MAHIGASQRFMPGIGLERKGSVRHCQGTVLADWVARSSDGQEKMSGTSVFLLGPGVKIDSVTSVRTPPRRARQPRPYFLKFVRSFTCSIQL